MVTGGSGFVVWLTGISGSGKSTIARTLGERLRAYGVPVEVLDGDEVRQRMSPDLGYTRSDRDIQVRRLAYVASLLARHGVVVLVAAISPYRATRDAIRRESHNFIEVHCACPLEHAEQRDIKGLYARARRGEIPMFTGVSDPYESPLNAEIVLQTGTESVEQTLDLMFRSLRNLGVLSGSLNGHAVVSSEPHG